MNHDFRTTPLSRSSMRASLAHIESAQLARLSTDAEPTYMFKHALVQDSAYTSLTRHERKRLHRLVAETLERIEPHALDENAALLAFHFEHAEEWGRALLHLLNAAERARRAAAHREEIALLARAITLAERVGDTSLRADAHARRGEAFTSITRWDEARQELEHALALLPLDDLARRAKVLTNLAVAQQWLLALEESQRLGSEALALAEQTGRTELIANALSALAMTESIGGQVRASVAHFDQLFERAGALRSTSLAQGMEIAGLAHYWLGHYPQAIARNREAVQLAREVGDSVALMRGLSNIGMALSAHGEYRQALQAFAEAREFGRAHGLGAWLARQLAIEGGLHLELFDFAGAADLAREAQELAQQSKFIVAIVSPGVDLILNYARTGHLARAAEMEFQVVQALPAVRGAHVWLLDVRFTQARAELAAARLEWDKAFALAEESLALSRLRGRIKYEALALQTRARALKNLGRAPEALDDMRAAVALARETGDPALFVRAALAQLELERDDALMAQTRDAARHISRELADEMLRSRFEAYLSEWI